MTRLIAAAAMYHVGFALFQLGCLCGRTSAALWVANHPEPPLDDDDDADVRTSPHLIERGEPERRTLH